MYKYIIKIISFLVAVCFYSSTFTWAMPLGMSRHFDAQDLQIQSLFKPIVGDASWDYLVQLNTEKEFILRMLSKDMPFGDINIELDEWVLSSELTSDSRLLNILSLYEAENSDILVFLEILSGKDKGLNFVLQIPKTSLDAIRRGGTVYPHRALSCPVPVSGIISGLRKGDITAPEYKALPNGRRDILYKGAKAVLDVTRPDIRGFKDLLNKLEQGKKTRGKEYVPPVLFLPMTGFDHAATRRRGHVVFSSSDEGLIPDELINMITSAELDGLISVNRLKELRDFYDAAVSVGVEPNEYIFRVFTDMIFLLITDKDTFASMSETSHSTELPAAGLMGKFLEDEHSPIRVNRTGLKGKIKNVLSRHEIEFGEHNSRRLSDEEFRLALASVDDLVGSLADKIGDEDGRKILLDECLDVFRKNPPKNVFVTDIGWNGFFGAARPGLIVIDEDMITRPAALLHEILEYVVSLDKSLLERVHNYILSEQAVEGLRKAKIWKYINEIHKNLSDEQIKDIIAHYDLRFFSSQLFPEENLELTTAIRDKQNSARVIENRPIHATEELAGKGAIAFRRMLDEIDPEDRAVVAVKLAEVYAGTSAEKYHMWKGYKDQDKGLKDLERFRKAVEDDPNYLYVSYGDEGASVINVEAAKRIIELHSEYFPEEAIDDTKRWLKRRKGEWSSYLWADPRPFTRNYFLKNVRHGLLTGYPLNAAAKYQYKTSRAFERLLEANKFLQDYFPERAIPDEDIAVLKRSYALANLHPRFRAEASEVLRIKARGILPQDEMRALIDENIAVSHAVPTFYAYGEKDERYLQELEKVFAYFLNCTRDIPGTGKIRDEIRSASFPEKLEELGPEGFTLDDRMEFVVSRGDSLVVFEHDGRVEPVKPLKDMTAADNLMDIYVIVKIAARYGVSPVDLYYYLKERNGLAELENSPTDIALSIVCVDFVRKIGGYYDLGAHEYFTEIIDIFNINGPLTRDQVKDIENVLEDKNSNEFAKMIDAITGVGSIISFTTSLDRYPIHTFFARDHILPAIIRARKGKDKTIRIGSIGTSIGLDLLRISREVEAALADEGEDPSEWTVYLDGMDVSERSLEVLRTQTLSALPDHFRVDAKVMVLGYEQDREEIEKARYDILMYRTTAEYLNFHTRRKVDKVLNAEFLFVDENVTPQKDSYREVSPGIFQNVNARMEEIRFAPEEREKILYEYRLSDMAHVLDRESEFFGYGYDEVLGMIRHIHESKGVELLVAPNFARAYMFLGERFGREGLLSFEEFAALYIPEDFIFEDVSGFTNIVHRAAMSAAEGETSAQEVKGLIARALKEHGDRPPDPMTAFIKGLGPGSGRSIDDDGSPSQIGSKFDVREVRLTENGIAAVAYDREENSSEELYLTAAPYGQLSDDQKQAILDITPDEYKGMVKTMLRLFPEDVQLYAYNELHKDLFGFADPASRMIALHRSVWDDPVALFHEVCEYLQKIYPTFLKTISDEIDEEGLNWMEAHRIGEHYAIRAFTRQVFGSQDRSLTSQIKASQKLREIMEEIGYPKKALRSLPVEFDKLAGALMRKFSDISSVIESGGYPEVERALKQMHLELRRHGIGGYHQGSDVIRYIVSSLGEDNIFDDITASSVSSAVKNRLRTELTWCTARSQLGYIILKMLGVEDVTQAHSPGHVFLSFPRGESRRVILDLTTGFVEQVDLSADYVRVDQLDLWMVADTHKNAPGRNLRSAVLRSEYGHIYFPHQSPATIPVYNKRGSVYAAMGEMDKAAHEFQKAGAIDPEDPDVLGNMGNIFHQNGYYEEAVRSYNAALSVNPELHEVYYNRSNSKKELGDIREAFEDMSVYCRLEPSDHEAAEELGELRGMIEGKTGKQKDVPSRERAQEVHKMLVYDKGTVALSREGLDHIASLPADQREEAARILLEPWKVLVDAVAKIEQRQLAGFQERQTEYREDEKRIKQISRASLAIASLIAKGKPMKAPVDISIDVSLIPDDKQLFSENVETLADLVLLYRDMENVNFVFESFPKLGATAGPEGGLLDVKAKKVLAAVRKKVLDRSVFVTEEMDAEQFAAVRISDARRKGQGPERPINVTLMPKEWLMWARDNEIELPPEMYPVALEDHIVKDKSMLINFEAAFALGISKAVLAISKRRAERKEKGAAEEYSLLRKELLVKLNNLFSVIRDDVLITEDTLTYMVDQNSLHRINRALDLVLPPAAKRVVSEILRLHDLHQLHLQAA